MHAVLMTALHHETETGALRVHRLTHTIFESKKPEKLCFLDASYILETLLHG